MLWEAGDFRVKGSGRAEEERRRLAYLWYFGTDGYGVCHCYCQAYVRSKAKHVFPLVGGRKIEHLKQNIEALSIKLTPEQIKYLESIVPFDVGFPTNFIGDDPAVTKKPSFLTEMSAKISFED
ncbi:CNT_collapsed_G0031270.mRNA.1.CDS.1 [Saccharomyces cerevisiae]|nr:CNT_collapsed_G0031270.mRNA.1.CDS.1 [Saccharomyces cerevisiae]